MSSTKKYLFGFSKQASYVIVLEEEGEVRREQ